LTRRKAAKSKSAKREAVPSVSADTATVFTRHGTLFLLSAATLLLQSLIFEPVGAWPLAFVCLVPWLLFVGCSRLAPRVYLWSYLFGFAFFVWNMRWMYHSTGAGYVALSAYLAVYFPLMACPIRHAVRRRGLPLAVAVAIVWTGAEMLRAIVISGFPWFYLSHSVYKVLPLIQTADLVGAYGVSFVIAAINGAIADLIFAKLKPDCDPKSSVPSLPYTRRARWGVGFALVTLGGTLVYGQMQLGSDTFKAGPKVAVVQGDFLMTVTNEETTDAEKRRIYYAMLDEAAKHKPDLVVLPETPWIMYLNEEARGFRSIWRDSFKKFSNYATETGAYVLAGAASSFADEYNMRATERRYNSAFLFSPEGGEPTRYDKVHTVYFGETVPFRFGRLRFLYFWLNSLMPFSGPNGDYEYSIFPGESFRTLEMTTHGERGRTYHFGAPICYEDVMPYVAREFVGAGSTNKKADFLINISNDGWFGRGLQQPQHLAICAFRAVENRVGIARSVNTGISAIIDPDGRIHDRVEADPTNGWPNACGVAVGEVLTDSRFTLYTRLGDWFGWTCALLWVVLYLDYWTIRALGRAEE